MNKKVSYSNTDYSQYPESNMDKVMEYDFEKNNKFLYCFALSILKNPEEAQDAVQDTWIQVCRHVHNFDSKKSTYRTWIATICKRICIMVIRKRKSQHYYSHFPYDDELAGKTCFDLAFQQLEVNEICKKIEKILSYYPEYIRIFNKVLDGHTSDSIVKEYQASHIKIKGTMIRTKISRIRKIIKLYVNRQLDYKNSTKPHKRNKIRKDKKPFKYKEKNV